MLFITPLFLIIAIFLMWALFKSLTRFKTQYLWYRHSRRPTNRVCRTIVGHQVHTQRQGSAAIAQQTICTHQCQQHQSQICQMPQEQLYYTRTQGSATNAYHPQLMEVTVPQNCYVPPYYYNPRQYQYFEPPPTYPGHIPATSQSVPQVSNHTQILYPTAPPLADEEKE